MSGSRTSFSANWTSFGPARSALEEVDEADLTTTVKGISSFHPSSARLTLLPMPALLTFTPVMVFIIVISVGGNVMVLMSYKHRSLIVDTHSLYLLNLAVSDLLISVVCMPLHLVSTIFSSGWALGRVMCKLYTAVQLTLLNVTTLVLVLVALDGFLQANEGVRITGVEAKRKAYMMLGACWMLAAIVHLPETLIRDVARGYSVVPENVCKPEFYRSVARVLFMQVWDFFLPVLILSVVNTMLYFRLKRLSRTVAFSTAWQTQDSSGCRIGHNLKLNSPEERALPDVNLILKSTMGNFSDSALVAFQPCDEYSKGRNPATPGLPADHVDMLSVSDGKASTGKFTTELFGDVTNLSGYLRIERKGQEIGNCDEIINPQYTTDSPALEANAMSREISVSSRSEPICTKRRKRGSKYKASGARRVSLDRRYRLKRVAIILFILVLILVVCWLPYSVGFLVSSICETCVDPMVYSLLVWVLYFKSCINPFLYAYNNFIFRNRFRRLLFRVFPTKSLRRMTTDRVSNERASIIN